MQYARQLQEKLIQDAYNVARSEALARQLQREEEQLFGLY
jgi:hypothetical protein